MLIVGTGGTGGGGGGGGTVEGIIWRPGGTAGANVYITEATAFAAAVSANMACTIYVDTSIAPAVINSSHNGLGALVLTGYSSSGDTLEIADGALLTRPRGFADLTVTCDCVTTAALAMGAGDILYLEGATLELGASATVPAIALSANDTYSIVESLSTIAGLAGESAVAFVSLNNNTTLNLYLLTPDADTGGSGFLSTGNDVGGGTGTVVFFRGVSCGPFASSLFGGTVTDSPGFVYNVTKLTGVPYGLVGAIPGQPASTIVPPIVGSSSTQAAVEVAFRGLTPTVVGTTNTNTLDFVLPNGTFAGRVTITGRLRTAGVGGGSVGDALCVRYLIDAKTIAGTTTLLATALDGALYNDTSMAGVVFTFGATSNELTIKVDATAQTSSTGAVTAWQFDLRGPVC